ncbi:acylCoA synthetase, putative [Acanthamoeba castellanii str. Neff]|uniref:Long-chain-fatty-acid--CoA ligase n=1 Tax=Acanthamoeba castellanii (strain ATCC 30010 / Neff) TaxID=1257118 RepID=L8GRK9_ACACF|nr:acylCoA synthetase, putative [Acanthamoeba castellanii str. Neff]ELR15814.1 acylCoA synthetase, putative [Acanthamoeba castellanii str. Neff]
MESLHDVWDEYGTAITATGLAVVGAAAAYHLLGSAKPAPTGPQSVMMPPEKKGESHVYRSIHSPDTLVETFVPETTTLYENFKRGFTLNPEGNCLGWRQGDGPYQWLSYRQVQDRFLALGAGLLELGFKPKDTVGIYSRNRPEWVITEQAANAFSMVVVPLYDTLGEEAVEHILRETSLKLVFCTNEKVQQLIRVLDKSDITHIVTFDSFDDEEAKSVLQERNISLHTIDELIELGKKNPAKPIPPSRDDLCTICYTSGTTGTPKGAMLSHGNFIANVAGVFVLKPDLVTSSDVVISYLPLAHVFERILQAAVFLQGASIGFYRGTVPELFDDIATLRPTVFPSVPRLFNRLYDKVMAQRATLTGVKKMLFERAWAAKVQLLKEGKVSSPLWDRLVFSKIAAKLGARVRLIISGSAPISADVKDFLRICFSAELLEGYGQTECCAAACATMPGDTTSGHVGAPLPNSELKLVDVPDMKYFATDKPNPRGEICFRGPAVFSGYYQNPEKTAEVLEDDGWLHSGDIGEMQPNGTLKIIDRKKDIFKLSQGEYIAPDKLESAYVKSPFVAQIFIYGSSLKASLVAVVVPDPEILLPWAKEKAIDGDLAELCRKDQVKKEIMASLKKAGEAAHLKGFERLADIHLEPEAFSSDNGLVTPTFKLKRPQLHEHYKEQIDTMLAKLD